MKDIVLLKKLKAEESNNLRKIKREIERKQFIRKRIAGLSIAAAVIAISFAVYTNKEHHKHTNSIISATPQTVSEPTIIIDNSMSVAMESNNRSVEVRNIAKDNRTSADNTSRSYRVIVPPKYTKTVILDDGSEVILNAGSELSYSSFLPGTPRTITLNGEAYFKVKKSEQPFIVQNNSTSIKVYGTEFNVNTTRGGVETLLVSGSVGVSNNEILNEEIIIKPNQLLAINTSEMSHRLMEVNTSDYLGWLGSSFKYESRLLKDVLTDIAHWYGVTINSDITIDNKLVNIDIDKHLEVEAILEIIENMYEVEFLKSGGKAYEIITE